MIEMRKLKKLRLQEAGKIVLGHMPNNQNQIQSQPRGVEKHSKSHFLPGALQLHAVTGQLPMLQSKLFHSLFSSHLCLYTRHENRSHQPGTMPPTYTLQAILCLYHSSIVFIQFLHLSRKLFEVYWLSPSPFVIQGLCFQSLTL